MNAKKTAPILGLITILIVVFVFINMREPEVPTETPSPIVKRDVEKKAKPDVSGEIEFRLPRYVQDVSKLVNDPNNVEEQSEMTKDFLNPDSPEEVLVDRLRQLTFSLSKYANGGYLPGAENIDIANGLLGNNKRKIAYLPADSIRLNEHGELIDSWGTPYDFHCESLEMAVIRSAGPDKLHYSDDDIVSNELK